MASDIIKFLRSEGKDHKGRTLISMLALTNAELEKTHDVIQWLFPSDIPSEAYPFAPILTAEDIKDLQGEDVSSALTMCLERMIYFYESDNQWITIYNHNFKRLTRMLRCLWLAGMKHDYVSLQKALDDVFIENPDIVGERTYLYWKNANNDSFMKHPQLNRYGGVLSLCDEAPKRIMDESEHIKAAIEFGCDLPKPPPPELDKGVDPSTWFNYV